LPPRVVAAVVTLAVVGALLVPLTMLDRLLPAAGTIAPVRYSQGQVAAIRIAGPARRHARVRLSTPRYTRVSGALFGSLGHCRYPPSSYADNQALLCPLRSSDRLRSVTVDVEGSRGPFGIYVAPSASGRVAGELMRVLPRSRSGRLRIVLDRLGVTRPAPVGVPMLLGALVLSLVALCLAVALAARRPDDGVAP
jgi:hypothetical protein